VIAVSEKREQRTCPAGTRFISSVGELALRPGWPSMFRAYLHEEEGYRK
jgi:acyl-coenzyme A synthetase/AMP-(fatty) acid ligase